MSAVTSPAALRRQRRRAVLGAVGTGLLHTAGALVVVALLWWALVTYAVEATDLSDIVVKGPLEVWAHLVTDADAGEHRSELAPLTLHTLQDAGLGFLVGMLAAVVLALLFTLSRTLQAGVMPLTLLLRSIPLVAVAPVVMLVTGRATTSSVVVLATIVVLFPALAAVLFGLGQASRQSLDVVAVYGGGRRAALLKVALPGALPSLFAAARVSVPGAMTGALLAEWLSTGKGIGGSIMKFNAAAQFTELWASVAVITVLTLLLYNLVQVIEGLVLAGMGMEQ